MTNKEMSEIQTIDVTALEKADGVKDGDTLLLVRRKDDGTQECLRVDGQDFKGEDAYQVAKAAGYEGTYEEWAAQVARVSQTSVALEDGELVVRW